MRCKSNRRTVGILMAAGALVLTAVVGTQVADAEPVYPGSFATSEMVTLLNRPGTVLVRAGYYPNKVPNFVIILWRPGYREMDTLAALVSSLLLHKYTNDVFPVDPVVHMIGTQLAKGRLLGEWHRLSSGLYRTSSWISIHNQPDHSWQVTCGYD